MPWKKQVRVINGGGCLVVVWWWFGGCLVVVQRIHSCLLFLFTLLFTLFVYSFCSLFCSLFWSLFCSLFCSLSLLPLPSPSSPSLSLSFAVGAVMQCGRLVSTISAEPLLAAGIQMMCEIDRCRELNKMINASLFELPDALKSFSTCWYYMLVVVLPVISGIESVFPLWIRQSLSQKRPNNTFKQISSKIYHLKIASTQLTSPMWFMFIAGTVRSMTKVSPALQNTIRAMFVLIGSDPKSVQEWKKAKQFCSPAGCKCMCLLLCFLLHMFVVCICLHLFVVVFFCCCVCLLLHVFVVACVLCCRCLFVPDVLCCRCFLLQQYGF